MFRISPWSFVLCLYMGELFVILWYVWDMVKWNQGYGPPNGLGGPWALWFCLLGIFLCWFWQGKLKGLAEYAPSATAKCWNFLVKGGMVLLCPVMKERFQCWRCLKMMSFWSFHVHGKLLELVVSCHSPTSLDRFIPIFVVFLYLIHECYNTTTTFSNLYSSLVIPPLKSTYKFFTFWSMIHSWAKFMYFFPVDIFNDRQKGKSKIYFYSTIEDGDW